MTAMATETTFWSEKELTSKECCCCSKDDCVKDVYTEYYDSGVKEVYSEMILETFNINVTLQSNLNDKQSICNSCITQLKSAFTLKCNILKHYEAITEKINKTNQLKQEVEIKCEIFHDDEQEDRVFEVFFDDQKTETIDVKLEKQSDITRKRARKGQENKEQNETTDIKLEKKSDSTRKKTKLVENKKQDGIDNKKKTSKITKNKHRITAKSTILRENSLKLISNSSLWVFNWMEGRYRCFCCKEPYSDINLLKKHTETHKIEEIESKIQISGNNLVKVDVSDIFCKICAKNFNNLPSLIDHFKVHNIIINGHILVPIKINDLTCQICHEKCTNFHFLYRHMIKHYLNVICETCGAGFYQNRHLKQHIRKNHNPDRKLTIPRRDFKCNFCSERFKQFHIRIIHMIDKHGIEKPEFPCELCNKTYLTKGILNAHIKTSHNIKDKLFECDICMKKFIKKNSLNRHKDTHSDKNNYTCSICNNGFKLVTSLRRHIKLKHKS